MATFAVWTQRWFIILDDIEGPFTTIEGWFTIMERWFIRPRLVLLEKCCFPGCWHSSAPGRNKGLVRHLVYGSFQKPYPQRALSSFFRLRLLLIVLCWGVNANMKERGLSTWYKIKLALYTPGLFATTDDHEGFTLARLIDRTQEVAVSRTQHLLLHYSS